MAIHGQKNMFSINFNRGLDSLDQSEMALPRNSGKWYGTVERYLMDLYSGGSQNLVGVNLANRGFKFQGGKEKVGRTSRQYCGLQEDERDVGQLGYLN